MLLTACALTMRLLVAAEDSPDAEVRHFLAEGTLSVLAFPAEPTPPPVEASAPVVEQPAARVQAPPPQAPAANVGWMESPLYVNQSGGHASPPIRTGFPLYWPSPTWMSPMSGYPSWTSPYWNAFPSYSYSTGTSGYRAAPFMNTTHPPWHIPSEPHRQHHLHAFPR